MSLDNNHFTGYEQGSSRFSEANEIKESTTAIDLKGNCECGGLPLYSEQGHLLWVDGKDSNSLICSSPGGGKSRRIGTPLILSDIAAGNSIVVSDPKAELLKSSYEFLKRHDYDIKIINFREPTNSHRFNPLYRGAELYKNDRPDLAAEAFTEIGHCIYQQIHSEKDPFWEISCENVFCGLALLACEHVEPEDVTLGLIYRMFLDGEKRGGGKTYLEQYLSESNNEILEQALAGLTNSSHETRASIESVFSSQLSKLVINKSIDQMLTGESFKAEDFVEHKTALFICLKDESNTYSTIVSLLIHELYLIFIDYAEKHGGRLQRTIDFVLDEFSNFPQIIDMDNKASSCRSRNIRFFFFVQSLYQLRSVYGEDVSQTLLNCCDNWVLLQSRDMKILEQFAERCGDVYGKYSKQKRPLLSAASLQHLSKKDGEILILHGAEFPYIAELPDRSVYMESLGLREIKEIPRIMDECASEKEKFSLKQYVEKMRDEKLNDMMLKWREKEESPNETSAEDTYVSPLDPDVVSIFGDDPGEMRKVMEITNKIDEKLAELKEEEKREHARTSESNEGQAGEGNFVPAS